MLAVHNSQSRAKDFCDGGRKGRSRCAKDVCSRFVLAAVAAALLTWTAVGEVRIGFGLAFDLPTVNGPERSVSRVSVAKAKPKVPAHASMTRCRCHV
jgi:hypothetical protein